MPGLETILTLSAQVSSLVTGLNQATQLFSGFGATVTGVMDSVVEAAQRGMDMLQRLATTAVNLAQASSSFNIMRDSFDRMTASLGVSGQRLLNLMNDATMGMVSNAKLMQTSMTAMMLINERALGDAAETIPMLAKIAVAASRALGEDVSFMFDSIARGIGRASPMILDNLGFAIRLGEVYGRAAEALGVTTKELSIVERQTALLNEVMRMGEGYISKLGMSSDNLTASTAMLHKTIEDIRIEMGAAFAPVVRSITMMLGEVARTIQARVIPAFRILTRVISEAVGMPNPFEAIAKGEFVRNALARISTLRENLAWLVEEGADFQGAISAAMEEFDTAVVELENEKFAKRFADIQNNLALRIADIWADFHRRQAREEEDFNLERARREEDHQERLQEMQDRFSDDISDAIRKRDARRLIDLLKRQREEIKTTKADFVEREAREDEDRARRQARAREDAALREREAQESAAREWAAVQLEFDEAIAKLAITRDKAIAAADAAWKAEIEYAEEAIKKQEALLKEELERMREVQAELAQPVPPFFQTLGDMIGFVYGKLVALKDLIITLVTGEGDLPGWFQEIKDKIDAITSDPAFIGFVNMLISAWRELVPVFERIWELIGPEFQIMWGDLKNSLKAFVPLIPVITDLIRALVPILGGILVTALILATAALRGITRTFQLLLQYVREGINHLSKIVTGFFKIVDGVAKMIVGLLTGNSRQFKIGLDKFLAGIKAIVVNWILWLIDFINIAVGLVFQPAFEILESLLGTVIRFFDDLIGHSVIPDALDSITGLIESFFSGISGIWSAGWESLKTIVGTIWDGLVIGIGTSIGQITGKISDWVQDVRGTSSEISNVARNMVPSGIIGGTQRALTAGAGVDMSGWNFYGSNRSVRDEQDAVYGMIKDAALSADDIVDLWRRR